MALLRIRVSFKTFTPSNTGLEKASQYPELGSVFKAAFMKAACWFFTKMSVELAEANPHESWWKNTPPKFNIAPEKWWLEDESPFGKAYGVYVKLPGGSAVFLFSFCLGIIWFGPITGNPLILA